MEPPVQISSSRDLLQQPRPYLHSTVKVTGANRRRSLLWQAESAWAWCGRSMFRAPLMLDDDPANYDLQFRVSSCRPTKVPFVPEGRRNRLAGLLANRKAPAFRVAGKLVSMDIPSIDLHEVLALDLTWKGTL
jgi:hypothetical protein